MNDYLIGQFKVITDETDETIINTYLRLAASKVLEKCYPFGDGNQPVPEKYWNKQLDVAVILYSKRGAEGESAHNENGVNRSYQSVDDILKGITPHVKVVG